jgi:DNA invertase Pin-like site-specific DNA recombinase
MRPKVSDGECAVLPVAQYVRMSTDHQKYSIENQRALIQSYAAAHGMAVIRTYEDAGKSGVTLKRRTGLSALLADVVSGAAPFKAILVYDVSRWGRFQDADEAAHYEFLCKRAGISMIYCAEPFSDDSTPLNGVLKSLKRAMAGEFSRELGVKVSAGKARIGKMGFRIGGPPGFGLRRQLVADGAVPGQLLVTRQRKSIQTDRVRLVPGPADEIELIHRIYRDYIYLRRSERDIAHELNRERHTHFGRPWSRALVRTILTNEKYIGNNIVGRYSARLYTRQITNPPEKWSRCDAAFEPIVPMRLFEAARAVRRFNEKAYITREEIVKGLRAVLKREGKLTAALIDRAAELPTSGTVARRFGNLRGAYDAAGYGAEQYAFHAVDRELKARAAQTLKELADLLKAKSVDAWVTSENALVIGGDSSLRGVCCRKQLRHKHDEGWRIDYQRNGASDFILAARMRADAVAIEDWLLVPTPDLRKLPLFLRRSHQPLIQRYTYKTLDAVAKKLADSSARQKAQR